MARSCDLLDLVPAGRKPVVVSTDLSRHQLEGLVQVLSSPHGEADWLAHRARDIRLYVLLLVARHLLDACGGLPTLLPRGHDGDEPAELVLAVLQVLDGDRS